MITIKSNILACLREGYLNTWPSYRFGQYVFNQINSYLYATKAISNQSYAVNICRLSDMQFYQAMCYDSIKSEASLGIVSKKEMRRRAHLVTLLKRAVDKYNKPTVLELIIEACVIRDSYDSPSVLYYIENDSIIKGLEIMLKLNFCKNSLDSEKTSDEATWN